MRQLSEAESILFLAHIHGLTTDTPGRTIVLEQLGSTEEQAISVIEEVSAALDAGERVNFPGGVFFLESIELVDLKDACPDCDERRQDELVWIELDTTVECQSCGGKYVP